MKHYREADGFASGVMFMIMSRSDGSADSSEAFYAGLLSTLNEAGLAYLVGGTYAVNQYIELRRPTKDLDIFCRASDYPRVLSTAARAGYEVQVEDERWIAKVMQDENFCDVVFGSANMVAPVTDDWFVEEQPATIYGVPIRLLPPTELVWSKVFIMDRYKFDGNDVVHIILRKHDLVNWQRLMKYADQHWEALLMHLLRFRYIYPSDRGLVPEWVLDELMERVRLQRAMPVSKRKICRGRAFSREDFVIDVAEWGYADLVGEMGEMVARLHPEGFPNQSGGDDAGEGAPGGGSKGEPEGEPRARAPRRSRRTRS